MRTSRQTLVGMWTVALVGGLVGAVSAQEDASPGPVGPVWTTLVAEQCILADDDAHTSGTWGAISWVRDYALDCEVTYTDPRVSGSRTTLYHEDCLGSFPCVYWATHELTGPDGTWTGWTTGTVDPDRATDGVSVLTGTGAYEGLTFVASAVGAYDEPPAGYGLIYEGDPPPVLAAGA